jgi:hypothetical protein
MQRTTHDFPEQTNFQFRQRAWHLGAKFQRKNRARLDDAVAKLL